ncbi:MAG: aldehyde dehydrogenase family protein [Bryobacteraceae bacterium]|nr:aldehyde dehydrogenase family protein [Bryobacteraceae bacterium]MDW8377397.1 aldehyde dehydrogenase family protein [Bryobacterales bacterium]
MLQDHDLLSIQEVRTKVDSAYQAFQEYRNFNQQQVDQVVEAMAAAARSEARRLAELAVEETGYGNVAGKVAKNLLNADLLVRRIRGMKTIGVIRELRDEKMVEIAEPVGVVAAILPTTNPTSTAIYKTIISLKAGNAIVLSPHPRAKRCTCATVDVLLRAALSAGAPSGLIQCIQNATLEGTQALMRHPRTGVILSTGGAGIVRAAYSSGKPAFGVGPGNVPVLIDETAELRAAVAKVVEGKSFDYGTVCSSEQTIVAPLALRDRILAELKAHRAHLCTEEQSQALAKVLLNDRLLVNPDCVGQPPQTIAKMAGFTVPEGTSILVAEIHGIGKAHPLSAEKLSPVLSVYFVRDFAAALEACEAILKFGGLGHTCVIHSQNQERIMAYARRMPAFRVLVNTPAPQGSTGITTNLQPSMTLGCGAIAGNITSDNVGPQHLFNIKRIAWEVRTAAEAFEQPAGTQSPLDPGQVVAAVEKYLTQRGIALAPRTAVAGPVRAESAGSNSATSLAASVVDRFLSTRRTAGSVAEPAVSASACGCEPSSAQASPQGECSPQRNPTNAPAVAPAPPPIADFVCEADVRQALQEKRKIFIGPRTIITPSARDAAAGHDILVLAQRS